MAIYKEDILDIDLDRNGTNRTRLNRTIGKSDDIANRFGVRVYRNGVAEDLTGCTCRAYFTDSKGNRTTMTGGISGNKAYVTLQQACYANAGAFRLAIKLTGGGVASTVRIVDGMIEKIV